MAHIRQILANLSISVAEFKKSPKAVVKAVKSEPIAVIINNKPAFYCVPADILESLYQKFYEMNELQNIQDLNTEESAVTSPDDDDESFGVRDIFQSIEDEQAAKLHRNDDIIDPINNHVADPLDEEVANQLNNSIDKHLLDSAKKLSNAKQNLALDLERAASANAQADENDEHSLSTLRGLNAVDPIGAPTINETISFPSSPNTTTDLGVNEPQVNAKGDMSNRDDGDGADLGRSGDEAFLAGLDDEVDAAIAAADATAAEDADASDAERKQSDSDELPHPFDTELIVNHDDNVIAGEGGEEDLLQQDPLGNNDSLTNLALSAAIRDANQEMEDNRSVRKLVSGPHSFSLEHVAKTYSPYKQKKIKAKLKKEQKNRLKHSYGSSASTSDSEIKEKKAKAKEKDKEKDKAKRKEKKVSPLEQIL